MEEIKTLRGVIVFAGNHEHTVCFELVADILPSLSSRQNRSVLIASQFKTTLAALDLSLEREKNQPKTSMKQLRSPALLLQCHGVVSIETVCTMRWASGLDSYCGRYEHRGRVAVLLFSLMAFSRTKQAGCRTGGSEEDLRGEKTYTGKAELHDSMAFSMTC